MLCADVGSCCGSGQKPATEAFVSDSYATKSYVDSKVADSGGIVEQSLGTNGYVKFDNG